MKKWQNKYDGKVSSKRDNRRPRLTFDKTVSKILEEGYIKSVMTPRKACMNRLMAVNGAKEVCRDGATFSLATPLRIQSKAKL